MHDADAPMPMMTAILDEPVHARARVRRRHAVQIAPVCGDVLSSLQLPDLSPINAWRSEALVWSINVFVRGGRSRRLTDCRSRADAPAWIRHKTDNVRHGALECFGVGRVISLRHVSGGLPAFRLLHWAIVLSHAARSFAIRAHITLIETTDIVFALDSIPAVLAVTRNPLIVYTSNVMAMLGLRSLYFVLSDALQRLRYLRPGLAIVLVFTAAKMLTSDWVHISPVVSVAVIGVVLLATIAASVWRGRTPAQP